VLLHAEARALTDGSFPGHSGLKIARAPSIQRSPSAECRLPLRCESSWGTAIDEVLCASRLLTRVPLESKLVEVSNSLLTKFSLAPRLSL